MPVKLLFPCCDQEIGEHDVELGGSTPWIVEKTILRIARDVALGFFFSYTTVT